MTVLAPPLAVEEPSLRLRVRPWPDPVLDRMGHDPRSVYCERFWLPLLGPSAVLLARQLVDGLERSPEGYELAAEESARMLGLGWRGGRRSPFHRTLLRLGQFRMLHLDERNDTVLARRRLPGLSRSQVQKLPPTLQAAHGAWLEADLRNADMATMRDRSRRLALTLFELGEGRGDVERHLQRLRFHPTLIRESSDWAAERHGGPAAS